MDKISNAQVGQMTKLAATAIRALSERVSGQDAEITDLKTKVAQFEKKAHAEKVARMMEDKGIESSLSPEEKVASLMQREDLRVVEEAVSMSSPQMKLASVSGDAVTVEGGVEGQAENTFAAALASM